MHHQVNVFLSALTFLHFFAKILLSHAVLGNFTLEYSFFPFISCISSICIFSISYRYHIISHRYQCKPYIFSPPVHIRDPGKKGTVQEILKNGIIVYRIHKISTAILFSGFLKYQLSDWWPSLPKSIFSDTFQFETLTKTRRNISHWLGSEFSSDCQCRLGISDPSCRMFTLMAQLELGLESEASSEPSQCEIPCNDISLDPGSVERKPDQFCIFRLLFCLALLYFQI